jgi:hypothetical protein
MRDATSVVRKVVCGFVLLNAWMSVAQPTPTLPPAPIPTPLVTAKTLFIANGGGDHFDQGDPYTQGPDRPYYEFYAEMKELGRFRLVTNPSDADLVCAISMTSSVVNGVVGPYTYFKLHAVFIDPKTHMALWSVSTMIEPANRQATRDQNFDKAMAYIVTQIKGVTGAS